MPNSARKYTDETDVFGSKTRFTTSKWYCTGNREALGGAICLWDNIWSLAADRRLLIPLWNCSRGRHVPTFWGTARPGPNPRRKRQGPVRRISILQFLRVSFQLKLPNRMRFGLTVFSATLASTAVTSATAPKPAVKEKQKKKNNLGRSSVATENCGIRQI